MKKQLVIAAAVLAMAGAASAQTTNKIYLTGATAYRAATHKAITNLLSGCVYAHNHASDMTKAGRARFIGTYSGQTVEFLCVWSGSVDGIQRLVYSGNSAYNVTNWPTGGSPSLSGQANASFGNATNAADAAMSDAYQNSTVYQDPALVDTIVGVIPFKFVRNNGAPNTITNVTPMIMQQMLSAGNVPLSFFSGSTNDASTNVKFLGRNADSGTRVCTFAETGFGLATPPNQAEIWVNGSNVITNVRPYRAETVLGVSYAAGQSGYASGGTVATAMTRTGSNDTLVPSANRCWLIGAMSVSDASTATNGGGAEILWNGVQYSPDNVRNGKYTFWSHEHMFYRTDVDTAKQPVLDALATGMQDIDPGTDAVQLNTMTVGRSQEGAPVAGL